MFLFRPHRGSLGEAMDQSVELDNFGALVDLLESKWRIWLGDDFQLGTSRVRAEPYGYDSRINWDTHIVISHIDGSDHVEGFVDRAIE